MPADPRLAFLNTVADWVGTAPHARARAPGRASLALACARLAYAEPARALARLAIGEAPAIRAEAAAAQERVSGPSSAPPAGSAPPGEAEQARTLLDVALALERVGDGGSSANLLRTVAAMADEATHPSVLAAIVTGLHEGREPSSEPDPLAARALERAASLEPRAHAALLGRCSRALVALGLREPLARQAGALRHRALPLLHAESLARALEAAEGEDVVREEDARWAEEVLLAHERPLDPLDLPFLRFALGRDPEGAAARARRLEAAFVARGQEASALTVALASFERLVSEGNLEVGLGFYEALAARARAARPWDAQMRFSVRVTSHAPRLFGWPGAVMPALALVALGRTAFLRRDPHLAAEAFAGAARLTDSSGVPSKPLLMEIVASAHDLLPAPWRCGPFLAALGAAARAARQVGDAAWGREYLRKLSSLLEPGLGGASVRPGPPPSKRGLAALVAKNKARASEANEAAGPLDYDPTRFNACYSLVACARAALGLGSQDDGLRWLDVVIENPRLNAMDATTVLASVLCACSEEALDDSTRYELATRAFGALAGEPSHITIGETLGAVVSLTTGLVAPDAGPSASE